MMKGEMKHYTVCLCLLLFAGIFTGSFGITGNTATESHCITPSNAAKLQDPGIFCIERCETECEPGHWYSGLCRGLCILGCSSIPPDFPSVSELQFQGMYS